MKKNLETTRSIIIIIIILFLLQLNIPTNHQQNGTTCVKYRPTNNNNSCLGFVVITG